MKLWGPSWKFKWYSNLGVERLNCCTFLQSWCISIGNWHIEKCTCWVGQWVSSEFPVTSYGKSEWVFGQLNIYIHTLSDTSITREAPNHVTLVSVDHTSKHLCLAALGRLSPYLWPVPASALSLTFSWGFHKSFGCILSCGLCLMPLKLELGVFCLWFSSPLSHCLVAKSCPTLYDSMDCSPPVSSIYGIFQDRILEWVAISFSPNPSQLFFWVSKDLSYFWYPNKEYGKSSTRVDFKSI